MSVQHTEDVAMPSTDVVLIISVEIILVVLTLLAVLRDFHIHSKERSRGIGLTVQRGAESMKSLYTAYAASLASFLVIVNNASGIDGQKVLAILIAFACLTYLFYFNTWFRNAIYFPMRRKMGED